MNHNDKEQNPNNIIIYLFDFFYKFNQQTMCLKLGEYKCYVF
jgi:hypothetical protein